MAEGFDMEATVTTTTSTKTTANSHQQPQPWQMQCLSVLARIIKWECHTMSIVSFRFVSFTNMRVRKPTSYTLWAPKAKNVPAKVSEDKVCVCRNHKMYNTIFFFAFFTQSVCNSLAIAQIPLNMHQTIKFMNELRVSPPLSGIEHLICCALRSTMAHAAKRFDFYFYFFFFLLIFVVERQSYSGGK